MEERAQLVVASPLVRTMETAIIGFSDVLKDANWLLDADLQEFPAWGGKLKCNAANTSAGRGLLTQYQRDDLIPQYDNLNPTWTDRKSERFKDGRESERFDAFTKRLAKREESRIIVVSHGNVMKDILGWKSENAQVRVYSLCDDQWLYLGAEPYDGHHKVADLAQEGFEEGAATDNENHADLGNSAEAGSFMESTSSCGRINHHCSVSPNCCRPYVCRRNRCRPVR